MQVSLPALKRPETGLPTLLGGKWRFARRKVGVCTEESPGLLGGGSEVDFPYEPGVKKFCLISISGSFSMPDIEVCAWDGLSGFLD